MAKPDYTGIPRDEVRRLEKERAERIKTRRLTAKREYAFFEGVIREVTDTHVVVDRLGPDSKNMTISKKLIRDPEKVVVSFAYGAGIYVETWYMRKRGWIR